jgi:hypothetical protein
MARQYRRAVRHVLWGYRRSWLVATPLEKPDPRYDLANTQRFYQVVSVTARGTASGATQYFTNSVGWAAMRIVPTPTLVSAGTISNATPSGLTQATNSGGYFQIFSTAAGDAYVLDSRYALSADL